MLYKDIIVLLSFFGRCGCDFVLVVGGFSSFAKRFLDGVHGLMRGKQGIHEMNDATKPNGDAIII